MKIRETGFRDLVVIIPSVYTDSRGYFFESFNKSSFEKEGIFYSPVQDNESKSSKGVIRGLHYQLNPMAQAKLIRVISGKIYDVALDLRKDSQTFGKWFGIELDSESKEQLFIPKGFAHGFVTLEDDTIFTYKCSGVYNKTSEASIRWNDPELNIDWGISDPLLSEKDKLAPLFKDASLF